MISKVERIDGDHDEDANPNEVTTTYKGYYKSTVSRTVSIPPHLQGFSFLICIIKFLRQKTLEQSYFLYKYPGESIRLIEYLSAKYESSKSVPNTLLQGYSIYLSEQGLAPSAIRTSIGNIVSMIKWSIVQAWFKSLDINSRNFVLNALDKKPSIPKNKMLDGVAPAMSEIIKGKEYDDQILLHSMIRFCFAFLSIFRKHREAILSSKRVLEEIDRIRKLEKPEISWQFKVPNMKFYNEIFNSIISSQSNSLLERLASSHQPFRDEFLNSHKTIPDTTHELYTKLKTCVRSNGSISFVGDRSKPPYVTFEQLDVQSLVGVSQSEEICIRWMLAIDRIQKSGQDRLLLEDIDLTPSHATVSFLKRRSGDFERDSTPYKRKTSQYKILDYTYKLRQAFEEAYGTQQAEERNFFQYGSPFARRQTDVSISFRPIILACTPGTNLHKEILDIFPKADYFQKYYRDLIDRNSETYHLRKSKRKSHDTAEDSQKQSKDSSYDDGDMRQLTVNVVAQSRAIVEPEHTADYAAAIKRAAKEARADGAAHSVETAQDIYINRSQTEHRLERRSDFVNKVGKLQESDARKLRTYLDATKIVAISEINELLGWEPPLHTLDDTEAFNQIVEQAEADGYSCVPFGFLSKAETLDRVVIITPITAALMLTYIKACQNELKKSNHISRHHAIIIQLCYTTMILRKFDRQTVAEGRKIVELYELPLPTI